MDNVSQVVPIETKKGVNATEVGKKQVLVDGNTIMYLIYLLYKCNIINNLVARQCLDEIKKQAPEDIIAYFQKEFTKI